jgi:Uma2 family endonuclease
VAATILMDDLDLSTEIEPVPRDDEFYEVVNGERIGKPLMSAYAVKVGSTLVRKLGAFADDKELGEVVGEMLFRLPLREDASRNRRPDLAYVSFARWPADRPMPARGDAWDVVPDLAVEVISPTNLTQETVQKVQEYFQAGVRLVWIVFPLERLVYAYESPRQIRVLAAGDTLSGGDVLPGFELPIDRLFGPVVLPAEVA